MLESSLRHYYQPLLVNPVIHRIKNKCTPMQLTFLAMLLGLLFIPSLVMGHTKTALCLLWLSGYLDTLDGSLARMQNCSSDRGSVFDIMADRIVESAVLLALFLQAPHEHALTVVLMLISILLCITSFLVVAIFSVNQGSKGFHYSPGLIERAESFIFFTLMILIPSYFNLIGFGFILLVLLTTARRLIEFNQNQLKKAILTNIDKK